MQFRIEATKPTAPADLKGVLSAARDQWLESTEQVHAEGTPEQKALEDARAHVANMQLANDVNKPQMNGILAKAVEDMRALVKAQSAKPNAEHQAALDLMESGIDAAVSLASRSKVPVRCTVVGHFDVSTDGSRTRPGERVTVTVDSAG